MGGSTVADKKALEMQHIFKSFGGVHALRDVSFTAYEGKVNVLMGENGAGKSTLMRILAGAIQGDSGEIFIDGQKVNIYDPSSSRTAGIAMIYQELNLVPQLTVEANMYLGNEWTSVAGFVRIKDSKNKAQALLDEYDLGIDARVEVSTLSIAQQQMLDERQNSWQHAADRLSTLKRLEKKPYFARIDFQEKGAEKPETVYKC